LHQSNHKHASLRWLAEWSRTFDWQRRAAAYDAEQLARERAAREQAEAVDRQRRHTQRLADLDALRPLADEARDLLAAMRLLKDPVDILKFYEFIHKGERLEMGEATDRADVTSGGERMGSVADLYAYAFAQGARAGYADGIEQGGDTDAGASPADYPALPEAAERLRP
jgi:hypothetical protein